MKNGGKLIINLPEGQEWQEQLEQAVSEVAKGYVREAVSLMFEREIERLVNGRVRNILDENSYNGGMALNKIIDKAIGSCLQERVDLRVKEVLSDEKVENMIRETITRRIINKTWDPNSTIERVIKNEINGKSNPFLEEYVEKHIGEVVSKVLARKMK